MISGSASKSSDKLDNAFIASLPFLKEADEVNISDFCMILLMII
jgi:hypothetical protein